MHQCMEWVWLLLRALTDLTSIANKSVRNNSEKFAAQIYKRLDGFTTVKRRNMRFFNGCASGTDGRAKL